MINLFKSIKKDLLILSLVYVVVGLMLLIGKKQSIFFVLAIVSIGFGIAGIMMMIKYLMMDVDSRYQRNDFLIGSALLVSGIFIYFSNSAIALKAPLIFGLSVILSGFLKIQDFLDSQRVGKNVFLVYAILALVCLGLGLLIIMDILKTEDLMYLLAGISLIFAGISDLSSNIYLAFALADYKQDLANEEKLEKEINQEAGKEDDISQKEKDPEDPNA